jgi:hypothetical protein
MPDIDSAGFKVDLRDEAKSVSLDVEDDVLSYGVSRRKDPANVFKRPPFRFLRDSVPRIERSEENTMPVCGFQQPLSAYDVHRRLSDYTSSQFANQSRRNSQSANMDPERGRNLNAPGSPYVFSRIRVAEI